MDNILLETFAQVAGVFCIFLSFMWLWARNDVRKWRDAWQKQVDGGKQLLDENAKLHGDVFVYQQRIAYLESIIYDIKAGDFVVRGKDGRFKKAKTLQTKLLQYENRYAKKAA